MRKSGVRSKESGVRGICAFAVFLPVIVSCLLFFGSASADEIRAKAAVAIEADTGRVLYGKNLNLKLPPASTAKLMTAMVVLDRADINDMVSISKRAADISPIKVNFRPGERATVKALLYAALIRSANDAALALAETVGGSEDRFVELMNQKAMALGMTDAVFANATGLPGGNQHITAYDLAMLMRHALRYPLIREIINTRAGNIATEDGRSIFLKNINKLLWEDEAVLGGKTGYTREAKHCFVCAGQQGEETVIVAVLGAPSREVLWKESEGLLRTGFAVRNGHEEPLVHFAQADYTPALRKVSYVAGSTGKTVNKKTKKYAKKIKKKTKAYAGKHKNSKNNVS